MTNPTPPREFVSALRTFDASLRIRWGARTSLWIIERAMPPRHKQLLAERPNPWHSARGLDLYDGWREGYLHVMSVHPSLLDHRVFAELRRCDIWAQGGLARLTDRLDAIEEAEEKAADREIHNFNEAAAKEMHDRLAWLQGRRVAVGDTVTAGEVEHAS